MIALCLKSRFAFLQFPKWNILTDYEASNEKKNFI